MKNAREKLTEVGLVSLAGIVLLIIVFFCPNGDGYPGRHFFQSALATRWSNMLDWPAAWCSVKIIFFSASLFMLIDSFGTFLLIFNRRRLAGKVFILIIVPFMGLMVGAYYLVKSLL